MPSITIRNIDSELKTRLRVQAAQNGHSMEAEARAILHTALGSKRQRAGNLAAAIRSRTAPLGGINLPRTKRRPMRRPPEF